RQQGGGHPRRSVHGYLRCAAGCRERDEPDVPRSGSDRVRGRRHRPRLRRREGGHASDRRTRCGVSPGCRRRMNTEAIAALLEEAAEKHHLVYRITDGDDPDWASWYADWLLDLSELPDLLGERPVRSHLVHALVQLDRDFAAAGSSVRWQEFYASRLA